MFRKISVFAVAVCTVLAASSHALSGTIVNTRNDNYRFTIGSSNTTGFSYVYQDVFEKTQDVPYSNDPLRYAWLVETVTPGHERWSIDIDVLCSYRAAYTTTDRWGNLVFVPERHYSTEFEATAELVLTSDVTVNISILAEGIGGVPQFQVDYFGWSVAYSSDANLDLIPPTNFPLNVTTPDPNDILDYANTLTAPAGTYEIGLLMSSGFDTSDAFRDGHARIVFDFTTVPEPCTMAMLTLGGLALLRRRTI